MWSERRRDARRIARTSVRSTVRRAHRKPKKWKNIFLVNRAVLESSGASGIPFASHQSRKRPPGFQVRHESAWTRLTGSRSAGPVFAAFPGFLAGTGLASPENPCPADSKTARLRKKRFFFFCAPVRSRQTVREMLPYRRPAVLVSKRERAMPVFCPRLPVSDGNEQHDGEYPRAKAQDWRWNQKSERIDCCPSDKSESGTDIPRIYGRRTDRHEKRL